MAMPQLFGRTKNVSKRSKKYLEEALYVWLFKEGGTEVCVRQQLNQFLKSSKRVYKWEVGETLKKLRDRKLYYPALKVPSLKISSKFLSISRLQLSCSFLISGIQVMCFCITLLLFFLPLFLGAF